MPVTTDNAYISILIQTKMNKARFIFLLSLTPFVAFAQTDYTKYVDPFIGTGGHGHTYPGAVLPHGMVQLSPDTRNDGSWDGCGGYHYSDSAIYGFSHLHLSGTGASDYCDILVLPVSGKVNKEDLLKQKFKSRFKHSSEKASPGYYAVKLEDGNINVELTATTRVGFHKYTFNNPNEDANILLDLMHRDKVLDASIVIKNNHHIEGYRYSEGWAKNQKVFFVMEFSEPFTEVLPSTATVLNPQEPMRGTKLRACFTFKTNKPVYVKVALSPVSTEGAEKNMQAELPGWDFEKVKSKAKEEWNKELGAIEVSGGTEDAMKNFYSSLYHCLVVPNVAMDVDGTYRGRDDKTHVAKGYTYYTVFSLWDTFRAWHPLMTIIDRQRTLDYIKTFLAQYEQGGLLPVWELSSNETECMIGYHSIPVIADAMAKGITGFDNEEALTAMKKSAESRNRFGLGAYMDQGYLSSEDENESVSKTLEYAYDDWCIAQVADMLHHKEDYSRYMQRSQSWKNLFDTETGFMRARKNGGWYRPFDPREANNNYTEANAWQYTFFVPHDAGGLIERMGGNDAFGKKLDELFTAKSEVTGREDGDISGLIGQYAHGNEPSHGIVYLYNYIGRPWKMQERMKQIMNDLYRPTVDGMCGNEDCGQMSAWYVMNAMGFYQDCPGNTRLIVCANTFPQVKIHLESGKTFTLNNPNMDRIYYEPTFLDYSTIMNGGTYSIPLQPTKEEFAKKDPHKKFADESVKNSPANFAAVPVIDAAGQSFRDSLLVTIKAYKAKTLFYSIDGQTHVYESPFYIYESTPIKAWANYDSQTSDRAYIKTGGIKVSKDISASGTTENVSRSATARFYKMPHHDWNIKVLTAYAPQYSAGGNDALIDGIQGEKDWAKGNWQGYEGKDFECVIDMGATKTINKCAIESLQDQGSWIMHPKQVEFSFSDDGVNFSTPVITKNTASENLKNWDMPLASMQDISIKRLSCDLEKARTARYVKVKAVTYGKLPNLGSEERGNAWIFIDEIFIE